MLFFLEFVWDRSRGVNPEQTDALDDLPDLIRSLLLLILLFLFLPKDEPDDQDNDEDGEGNTHHHTCDHANLPHICGWRKRT